MKLSEVINNDDDLYKCAEFKNGNFKAVRTSDSINVMFEFDGKEMGVYVPLDGWEEVKPPRQFSNYENKLIKFFPWANYISKNAYGDLILTELKPNRASYTFELSSKSSGEYVLISTTSEQDTDTTITFEESPIYIGDLKGE